MDEPMWADPETSQNILSLMRLYRSVSSHIKIFQTRVPIPLDTVPGLLKQVDWWCAHVCQWSNTSIHPFLQNLTESRQQLGREFHITVYDNGVPIIESPWERTRYQALDVWRAASVLDGTLSWYSVNSYGTHGGLTDPWVNPLPSPRKGEIKDPAGFGFQLYPYPPDQRPPPLTWEPVESIRWVMLGAGIQDAEYLYALTKLGSTEAKKLIQRARALATAFPKAWNPTCPGVESVDWGSDGYTVDTFTSSDGISMINQLKLDIGRLL